jgi:hypothetical protein
MHYKLLFYGLLLMTCATKLPAQRIELLSSGTKTSIRGLSVVDSNIVWASGSNGKVAKSTDGGKTWSWHTVKGFENKDFRDIEAFDEKTAIIISVAEPAYILKTFNGGESWKVVFEDSTKGMFLDAMEFWNIYSGIVVGDPINGKLFVARTFDGGNSWMKLPARRLPAVDSGEALFAASGTNVRKLNLSEACIVTGGRRSRFIYRDKAVDVPIVQGTESSGANSIAVWGKPKKAKAICIVGGDFSKDNAAAGNCFISYDLGKSWITPKESPHGYRSCVEFIDGEKLISCGINGVDVSQDGGMKWKLISNEGFHVCRKSKKDKTVYLAGGNGKIAKLQW